MTFKDFQHVASKIKKTPLPGIDAQFKLAPIMRKKLGKVVDLTSKNPKKAAVMALMYPKANGELVMIFMLRKTYQGVHSNQIGFPGGKIEDYDENLMATAYRETFEEIGVSQDQIEVLKELTEVYIPPSNFLVQPYLGILAKKPNYVLEEKEVERLIEIPLKTILNDEHVVVKKISTIYVKDIEVPAFCFDDEVIWGATAMMLSEIKELLLAAS